MGTYLGLGKTVEDVLLVSGIPGISVRGICRR